jgi:hypothetical protein
VDFQVDILILMVIVLTTPEVILVIMLTNNKIMYSQVFTTPMVIIMTINIVIKLKIKNIQR